MSAGNLLREVSKALHKATPKNLELPPGTTYANYYRSFSKLSTHELDISYDTIHSQFKNLILQEPSLVNILGRNLNKFLRLATEEFIKNIRSAARINKFRIKNNVVLVDTSNNNFQKVRDLVNMAFKTTNAYNISEFMSGIASKLDIQDFKVPKTTKDKFGFDIGHVESNVASAYQAVILNSIRSSKTLDDNETLLKEIDSLIRKVNSPATAAKIMAEAGITSKDLFDSCVEATLGFTKRVLKNDIDVLFKIEPKLNKNSIRSIASQLADKVYPQAGKLNQSFGASFEKSLSQHLTRLAQGSFLSIIQGDTMDILNVRGSPSAKDLALDLVVSTALGKPRKLRGGTTKATLKPKKLVKVKLPKATNKPTTPKTTVPRLRSVGGKFTSLVSVRALINELLTETIADNMVRPNLKHQTGRFAESVKLVDLKQRGDTLQAFLTYMKYPYQTFEPGFAQGFRGYDPRRLIDTSVREIATKIVKTRMQTVVV